MNGNYYDDIAFDYHLKRKYSWRPLEHYIQELNGQGFEFHGLTIDIGCANGRHFNLFKNNSSILIGIDNSFEFLKIAVDTMRKRFFNSNTLVNHIHIIQANVLDLPIRPNKVHFIFSIATIHHLKDKYERDKALGQISEILKKNGYFLFTVWRKYQKKYRLHFIFDKLKRLLIPHYKKTQESIGFKLHGDKYVPWTLSRNSITYNRFYHFFAKKELKRLLADFKIIDISKRGGSTNKDNFFVISKTIKN